MIDSTHEEKLLHALRQLDYHGDRCYGGTSELEDRAQGLEDRRHAADHLLNALSAARALDILGPWKGRSRDLMLDLASGRPMNRTLREFTRDMFAQHGLLQEREDAAWEAVEGYYQNLEEGLAMGRDAARGGDQ